MFGMKKSDTENWITRKRTGRRRRNNLNNAKQRKEPKIRERKER